MQYLHNRKLWALAAFIALAAVASVATLAGHSIVSPEMLAGLGLVPIAVGNTDDHVTEIKQILIAQGDAFTEFKSDFDKRVADLEKDLNEVAKKAGRPLNPSAGGPGAEIDERKTCAITVDGKRIPMLYKNDSLANHYAKGSDAFDIGEYVRDAMLGSRKAASGPALVPSYLSAQIIDDVRRATVIVPAGAGTLTIDGPTVLARITGDPTVYQHTENTDDIEESDVTLEPVTVNPKMLAALIPLTAEVVSDSPNLNSVLNTSLSDAFAAKLDALCLATILADTDIPTSAAGQDPAVWAKVLEAVGAAMAEDQLIPTALVGNTADFIARAAQLASTAGSWLGKPPVLSGMVEYPTTGVSAGTAILGGFAQAFAVAMRQELRLEVIRWKNPGKATHLLVAHMRADGVVLQPKRLFIQQKTVT